VPVKVILMLDAIQLSGELSDTPAGQAMAAALPLTLGLSRWGDEYYGDLGRPLAKLQGETSQTMEVGDLAYWEPGNALCLFFGPTPASTDKNPRAASPVYRIGNASGDFTAVKALGTRVKATLARAE